MDDAYQSPLLEDSHLDQSIPTRVSHHPHISRGIPLPSFGFPPTHNGVSGQFLYHFIFWIIIGSVLARFSRLAAFPIPLSIYSFAFCKASQPDPIHDMASVLRSFFILFLSTFHHTEDMMHSGKEGWRGNDGNPNLWISLLSLDWREKFRFPAFPLCNFLGVGLGMMITWIFRPRKSGLCAGC